MPKEAWGRAAGGSKRKAPPLGAPRRPASTVAADGHIGRLFSSNQVRPPRRPGFRHSREGPAPGPDPGRTSSRTCRLHGVWGRPTAAGAIAIPRLDMGVAPKGRWKVVSVKDGLQRQGIWVACDPGLDPGEQAPRAGWGPIGLCPWGGGTEGRAMSRLAWPANRREKPSALPGQETMSSPREPEPRPMSPACLSRKLGRGIRPIQSDSA